MMVVFADKLRKRCLFTTRDADYLPFFRHISSEMPGRLENVSFEVVASNRTSVYEGIASSAHVHYGKIWKLRRRLPNDVFCVRFLMTSSGRLKKVTTSYDQTRRCHEVWKKSWDLRCLEDI